MVNSLTPDQKKFLRVVVSCLLTFMVKVSSAQTFTYADPSLIALYPQQNDFRNTLNLSGMWEFKKDSLEVGETENWQNGLEGARSIAVPGSWNEQFADGRNYLGMAWYETESYVPASWQGQRIFLRVGSANYAAKVWVNGQPVGRHEGGHLPFAFEIGKLINWGETNRVSIQIENYLKPSRVPTGNVTGGPFQSFPKANYDFFPYAGLHRDVWLYSIPNTASIKDITIKTDFENTTGSIEVIVESEGNARQGKVVISGNEGQQYEADFRFVNNTSSATVSIPDVRLWSPDDPYLYQVDVTIGSSRNPGDRYSLETGVRTISVTENQLLLNGEPIFLKGFGKHEDFPIFGKGTAHPVMVKDYALMKWTGANSFRTSHYPYDEEYMRMADREGFLVIDETPAVGLYFHGDTTELAQRQAMCKQYIEEMISRDKNHPSVIMWCIANEPFPESLNPSAGSREATPESVALFQELFDLVKEKDDTRLATLVGVMGGPAEWLGLSDIICINRYYGWYTHLGDMEGATQLLGMELDGLHQRFKKPIIITEFGADTYPGMHAVEPEMFTEEFQTQFIKAYLDVADARDYMAGMHVWAFSDFRTSQGLIRFGGVNYKGVFTRDRKPKVAAYFLRSRWTE
ncbi:beta-glucuronidase [Catalinimonas niigatensis]|uniref:beta-glucuronidase n=1 Tax=Catalinimonas niigatensis TaxID=1397264 RepID=UPI0026661056|nr:beta-glucuronidase [Catalinimonas niigatensis]WPP49145.1 beta-glucuronidase [Catalinimonas niigatensis]